MELKRKGPNVDEVTCLNGTRILFSYGEPVAFYTTVTGWARTDRYVSRTTERHITDFLDKGHEYTKVTHETVLRVAKEAA